MVDVDRAVELAACRQVERDPLGACARRLYQTELTVDTPHGDSLSPGSSVAPTTVPLIVAGRLWMACALARSSFAGAGTAGALVAASADPGRDAMVAAETAGATASMPARTVTNAKAFRVFRVMNMEINTP